MSIAGIRYKDGKYEWNVSYQRKRAFGRADSEEEALIARGEALMNLKGQTPPSSRAYGKQQPQAPTQKDSSLHAICAIAHRSRWCDTKSTRTTMINVKTILDFFGPDTRVSQITTDYVDAFVDHLIKHGNSGATINRKLSVLSVLIKTAEENGCATAKPTIRRRKEYKGRERFLTLEEENKILKILEDWGKTDMRDAVIVMLDTGMRCGELLSINRSDLDFKQGKYGIITLWTTKNDKPRSCPMTGRVSEIMKKRLSQITGNRLFPYTHPWLRTAWDRVRMMMGLDEDPQFVPHILRHTCASRLVQHGISLPIVQQWMGHLSLQSTMRYAHLSPSHLYGVVDTLESATV